MYHVVTGVLCQIRYIIDERKVVIDIVGGLKLLYRHLQDYKTKHTQVQNSCNGAYWLRFLYVTIAIFQ